MRLYLDTEFNGFGGELISLALATESASGKHFYGVLDLPERVTPWVRENVVPILEQKPESMVMLRHRLRQYLQRREPVTVYADFPTDFRHLMDLMAGAAFADSWTADVTMVLLRQTEPEPAMPHNALSDAIALRDWHLPRVRKAEYEANPAAHRGSTLDDWLKEEGIYEEVTAKAQRRVTTMQSRTSPGEMIMEEWIKNGGVTVAEIAIGTGMSIVDVEAIVDDRKRVTPEIADKLGEHFETSSAFWLNLQSEHDKTA